MRCGKRGGGGGGGGGGEIVEVEGGHIVRSIGRKDRHSKVCTAKGPRDRRVRLSAQTAIQFYDVQDRLGYKRPSKAVEWLINKAKSSIDQLAHLPPWKPTLQTPQNDAESCNPQILSHGASGGPSTYLPFHNNNDHLLFSGTAFDNSHACGGEGGRFLFNAPSTFPASAYSHHFFTQRGPLQSSHTSSLRACFDAPSFLAAADHRHHHSLSPPPPFSYQSAPSTPPFPAPDGFSGFCMPSRIFREDHHDDDDFFHKPSSASSDYRP